MGVVSITSTIPITTTITADLYKLQYLWCNQAIIQAWLDEKSVLRIGDGTGHNFSVAQAQRIENAVVKDIVAYYLPMYEITVADKIDFLIEDVSKLVAAEIAFSRFAASIGNQPSEWTASYRNDAWAKFYQYAIADTLRYYVTSREIPLWKRMIIAKRRYMVIARDV